MGRRQNMKSSEAEMMRRPTLRDVAREAGLSVTQTSRALNGHADVAEATKQRAAAAARRIRYRPNLEARRLKSPDGLSRSIGLILDTSSQRFSDPFFGELLTALVDEAAANGFELLLSAPLPDEDPVAPYRRAVRGQPLDGFVVLRTATNDVRVEHLADNGLPFVTFGESDHAETHPTVTDSDECLRPAVDHLVALGHSKIGCLAEPLEYLLAATRHRSFLKALDAHGIDVNPAHVVVAGYREEDGLDAAGQLLDQDDSPTALVAFNDLLALGAMQAAARRNINVPAQLSIVGFDDIYAAHHTAPPLTTLRHPAAAVGRSLMRELLKEIKNPGSAGHVYLETELVVRGSTGPVPVG